MIAASDGARRPRGSRRGSPDARGRAAGVALANRFEAGATRGATDRPGAAGVRPVGCDDSVLGRASSARTLGRGSTRAPYANGRACAACDDPRMVEYGGGVANGPAGQVAGHSGSSPLGQPVDVFGSISHTFNDAANFVLSQPPEVLLVGAVILFLGLVVLKRAF
jgi:hypothetical protein